MSFLFECPHCRTRSEVDDHFAGQSGPCFSCGKQVQLPAIDSEPYQSAARLLSEQKRFDRKGVFVIAGVTASLVVAVVGVWLILTQIVLPRIDGSSPSARSKVSQQNIETIAAAMLSYHGDYGSFPPAYVTDQQGRPAHSWRVLLLPYLGKRDLYNRYRFDLPWDSPENMLIRHDMPKVFASPADANSSTYGETSYMVIVGAQTPFPFDQTCSLSDLPDGSDQTVLVVEVFGSQVPWTAPEDLEFSQLTMSVNANGANGISSGHLPGAWSCTADGVSHWLSDGTTPEFLQAILTRDGGEAADWKSQSAQ